MAGKKWLSGYLPVWQMPESVAIIRAGSSAILCSKTIHKLWLWFQHNGIGNDISGAPG
jgi:hypothetical protein